MGGGNNKINKFINRYILSKKEKKDIINELKDNNSTNQSSSGLIKYWKVDCNNLTDEEKTALRNLVKSLGTKSGSTSYQGNYPLILSVINFAGAYTSTGYGIVGNNPSTPKITEEGFLFASDQIYSSIEIDDTQYVEINRLDHIIKTYTYTSVYPNIYINCQEISEEEFYRCGRDYVEIRINDGSDIPDGEPL